MPDDDRFVVDHLFPTKEIHLIFGPSGAGATTLLLQIINDWRLGRPIFIDAFVSRPSPFCLISCAKSLTATRRHMRRLGIDPAAIPTLALPSRPSRPEERSFHSVLTDAMATHGDRLKVLFIDGLSSLCSKVADDHAASSFMSAILEICGRMDITVIATIRASKARSGEGYISIRERILGSGAFCSHADSKIGVEPMKIGDPRHPGRLVTVLPQNYEPMILPYTLGESGLLPSEGIPIADPLDRWITDSPPGTTISTAELMDKAALAGVSDSTVKRWIRTQIELGRLEKTEHGKYRIPPTN